MDHFLGVLRCRAQVFPQCEEHTLSSVRLSSSIQSQCWFKVGGLHSTVSEVHNLIKNHPFWVWMGFSVHVVLSWRGANFLPEGSFLSFLCFFLS